MHFSWTAIALYIEEMQYVVETFRSNWNNRKSLHAFGLLRPFHVEETYQILVRTWKEEKVNHFSGHDFTQLTQFWWRAFFLNAQRKTLWSFPLRFFLCLPFRKAFPTQTYFFNLSIFIIAEWIHFSPLTYKFKLAVGVLLSLPFFRWQYESSEMILKTLLGVRSSDLKSVYFQQP